MLIQPWHVIYQFSVFFLDENNENPFWASCRKIRLLVLNYPVTFVLGLARCSSALCLFSFIPMDHPRTHKSTGRNSLKDTISDYIHVS